MAPFLRFYMRLASRQARRVKVGAQRLTVGRTFFRRGLQPMPSLLVKQVALVSGAHVKVVVPHVLAVLVVLAQRHAVTPDKHLERDGQAL